jgi:hypothetical protein
MITFCISTINKMLLEAIINILCYFNSGYSIPFIISYILRVVLTFLTVIFLYKSVPTSLFNPLFVIFALSNVHRIAPAT